ncbi:MAG: flagellar hook-associated protein FlgK [Nocardioidaceae bacterium]
MSSTFGSLSTALSALQYNQSGLSVASGNVANADVAGYTKRTLLGQTAGAGAIPAMWSRADVAGSGVSIAGVQRSVDAFLDARSRTENGRVAAAKVGADSLGRIEGAVNEPSDTGLQAHLSAFWSSWSTLATHPSDPAAQQGVLAAGQVVTGDLSSTAHAIDSEWTGARTQLDGVTADVNTTATELARLNHDIKLAKVTGTDANDLLDQRDLLTAKLATLTGADVSLQPDGTASVTLGGQNLVVGENATAVTVTGAGSMASVGGNPIALQVGGTTVSVTSGTAGGLVDLLDTTLPGQASALDGVASTLASTVNAQHHLGYDANGTAGGDFFSGATAATIGVAITDRSQVAAAAAPGTVDGANAAALAALASSGTGPDATYRTFVSDLGSKASVANQAVSSGQLLASSVDASRASLSGVSTDEEMVSLVTYQRGYEAAARVMTTLDSMLDTLINKTGVG